MITKGDTFKIGEICPESGVYKLKNCSCLSQGSCDISEKQYTIPLVEGKTFPPCRNCKGNTIEWEFVEKA